MRVEGWESFTAAVSYSGLVRLGALFYLLCLVAVTSPVSGWCDGCWVGGGVAVWAAWDALMS